MHPALSVCPSVRPSVHLSSVDVSRSSFLWYVSRMMLLKPAQEFRRMKRCGLPQWLYLMMACFMIQGVDLTRSLDCLDFVVGACGIKKAWLDNGHRAMSHEIKHNDVFQDINSNEGFVTCLLYGSKVRPGGIAAFGVVCSTWIWMCLKSTGRHLHPMGHQSSEAELSCKIS